MRKKTENQETFDSVLQMEKEQQTQPQNVGSLHESIINVMKAVKNIDKSMTVGSGQNAYKGVADKDVKYVIGQAMAENNLTCMPISIVPEMKIDRWDEIDPYSKEVPKATRTKQSIFVSLICTYRITHALTKESIEIVGYGHGVDPQDKAAGKATTYALKNALLYAFLVPTGAIDDTDKTHSNEMNVPKPKQGLNDKQFISAVGAINSGKYTKQYFFDNFQLTPEQINVLNELN